jgi:hypothetical protein
MLIAIVTCSQKYTKKFVIEYNSHFAYQPLPQNQWRSSAIESLQNSSRSNGQVYFGINLPPSLSYSSLTYQNLHQTGHIQEYYVKCHIKCRYNTFFQISCLDILILYPLVFPCDHRICLNIHLILSAGLLFVHLGSGKELFRGRGIMASGILYLQARNDNVLELSI